MLSYETISWKKQNEGHLSIWWHRSCEAKQIVACLSASCRQEFSYGSIVGDDFLCINHWPLSLFSLARWSIINTNYNFTRGSAVVTHLNLGRFLVPLSLCVVLSVGSFFITYFRASKRREGFVSLFWLWFSCPLNASVRSCWCIHVGERFCLRVLRFSRVVSLHESEIITKIKDTCAKIVLRWCRFLPFFRKRLSPFPPPSHTLLLALFSAVCVTPAFYSIVSFVRSPCVFWLLYFDRFFLCYDSFTVCCSRWGKWVFSPRSIC